MLWSREQTKQQQKRSTFLKQQPVENHIKAVHLEQKKTVHEKQHAKKETTTSNQQFSPGSEREVVKLLFKNKTNELKS